MLPDRKTVLRKGLETAKDWLQTDPSLMLGMLATIRIRMIAIRTLLELAHELRYNRLAPSRGKRILAIRLKENIADLFDLIDINEKTTSTIGEEDDQILMQAYELQNFVYKRLRQLCRKIEGNAPETGLPSLGPLVVYHQAAVTPPKTCSVKFLPIDESFPSLPENPDIILVADQTPAQLEDWARTLPSAGLIAITDYADQETIARTDAVIERSAYSDTTLLELIHPIATRCRTAAFL